MSAILDGSTIQHSKRHDEQVASLAGRGYSPYRVDETGTDLMKPRRPNSVPLNSAATVLTGGLWLVTAMPIISTSKQDRTRFVPSAGTPDHSQDVSIGAVLLGSLLIVALIGIFVAGWAVVSFFFTHPVLFLVPGIGLVALVVHRLRSVPLPEQFRPIAPSRSCASGAVRATTEKQS